MYHTINPQELLKKFRKTLLVPLLILGVYLFFSIFVTIIPVGQVGVSDFFGKVSPKTLKPGLNIKTPLAKIILFNTQTNDYTMSAQTDEGLMTGNDSIKALTKEGLSVELDMTVLYHLDSDQIPKIYQKIGLDIISKIIRPSIRSVIREITTQYTTEDLYSEKRSAAVVQIQEKLNLDLKPRGIIIEEVLLRNVKLPAKLANSIEEKLQAEQESQRYEFVLEKETKEAERKEIEAKGQESAQSIINQSLTNKYLHYLYLQGLSQQKGTIYVPTNPSNGLPLFKNIQ